MIGRLLLRSRQRVSRGAVFAATASVGLALTLFLPAAAAAATPNVITLDVFSTGATTATAEGLVDPNDESTTYAVQYNLASSAWCTSGGTSGSPANTTAGTDPIPADGDFHFVSVDLTGVVTGTDYCAQVIATNGSGEGDGGQVEWTEGTASADTFDAFSTELSAAMVEGDVNQAGDDTTTYQVQYDLSSSTWCQSGGDAGSPANTTTATATGLPSTPDGAFHDVSVDVTGLDDGTNYCAQLIATNAIGEGDGGQVTWTQGSPTTDTLDAFATGASTATVDGDVNPAGKSTTYRVDYDVASSDWCQSSVTSGSPAYSTSGTTLGSIDGTFHTVSVDLTGLSTSTDYCGEIVATNVDGTSEGGQLTWTQPAPPQATLTMSVVGSGTVTSSPAGINCGPGASACSAVFTLGTQVTLIATPAAGSFFLGWAEFGGPGLSSPCSSSSSETCAFTLSVDQALHASFGTWPTSDVIVQLGGAGSGTVTSSPAGIDCGSSCSHSFSTASPVTLTATAATGSMFAGWSGGGCSGTGTCTNVPPLNGVMTVTATFTKNPSLPPPPPPRPRCILKAAGSKVKLTGPKAGVLTLKVKCNQAASFSITGKATIKLKHGQKTKTSHASLKARHGSAKVGITDKVTMKLPRAALSKLRKRAAESVAFRLKAKDANGSRTTTARIKHLKIRR